VGVCSWKPGQKIKVDSRGFVSVGSPFPDIRMQIKNNQGKAKPGEMGEIWVQSKSNTSGYYKNPKATRELFGEGDFIKTGDLGYMDIDGDYYIVGRMKNIIKQAGVNISSREAEEILDPIPFVRRTAALGVDRGRTQGEQVYVFLEVNLKRSLWQQQEILKDMTIEVVQRFKDTFGFTPGRVYLLKSRSIPMTYNGKIKYQELKDLYLAGTLRARNLILFPEY
jgi:acyl-CoA synthetase (AMP-forming)/AMP-acid ligase II